MWHDSGDQWWCLEHEHDIGHMSLVHFLVWHVSTWHSDVKYLTGCCCCFHFTARVIRHCETRFADPGAPVTARYRFNRQIQWRQSSKGHNILTILTHLKFVLFPHGLTALAPPHIRSEIYILNKIKLINRCDDNSRIVLRFQDLIGIQDLDYWNFGWKDTKKILTFPNHACKGIWKNSISFKS